jgi:4-hydroxy-4-methyl-2-oxoglutarate aldolase
MGDSMQHALKAAFEAWKACGALFSEQSSATLHEVAGRSGALSSNVKPIAGHMRVAGVAFPMQLKPGDNLALHQAIYEAPEGAVLMIDAFDATEFGPFGEIMAVAAQARGLAGLVTSGAVRDSEAITKLGFPVFSKGVCIRGTDKHVPGRFGLPVVIDGVVIHPGDFVLGDADGVVIIPHSRAAALTDAAVERELREREIMQRLRNGARTLDVYSFATTIS